MTRLRQSFLIFGLEYRVVGEPCDTRLIRMPEGVAVAHYGKSWDPREVIADATHDARVITERLRTGSTLTALLTAFLLTVAVSGAWARGTPDVGPPTDKPGPTIPVSSPAEHDVQASWAWWIGFAGYLEVGPFASIQACEAAKRRFPTRYQCVPVKD